MISLRLFLVLLLTLVCREFAGADPHIELTKSALAVGGVCLGFGLLAKSWALAALNRITQDRITHERIPEGELSLLRQENWLRRYSVARRRVEWLWACCLPITLIATGWAAWTNALAAAGSSQLLMLVMLFLPTSLVIALLELTSAQLEALVPTAAAADEPGSDLSWVDLWRLRLRLGEFAQYSICLLPVLLIGLCNDCMEFGAPVFGETGLTIVSSLVAIVLITSLYPLVLSHWMGAKQQPGSEINARIERLRKRAGLWRLDAVLVPSYNRWTGAAVVGALPFFRKLWLGDGLIRQLDDRQLDMVVLHEIAHVKRLHFLWRSMPIVWAAGMGLLCWLAMEQLPSDALPVWIGRGTAVAVSALTLIIGLGCCARCCELDADREACQLASQICAWAREDPAAPAAALGGALNALLEQSHEGRQQTWLHPSLSDRLANLANQLVSDGRAPA